MHGCDHAVNITHLPFHLSDYCKLHKYLDDEKQIPGRMIHNFACIFWSLQGNLLKHHVIFFKKYLRKAVSAHYTVVSPHTTTLLALVYNEFTFKVFS